MKPSLLIALLLCGSILPNPDGFGMVLTNDPKQLQPIRIPVDADARVVQAAEELSRRLGTMFCTPFPLETGQGEGGIIPGTAKEDTARAEAGSSHAENLRSGSSSKTKKPNNLKITI